MQSRAEIFDGLFLKPMMVQRRKCIVVMHEISLVLRADKFRDLIIQLCEMQVERPDGLTIFLSDVIVFPQLLDRYFGLPISGSKPID
jgi:hypothetical protein